MAWRSTRRSWTGWSRTSRSSWPATVRRCCYAVRRCCELKAAIVAEDERESGVRALLNFGHTFGHAIEAGSGYGAWLHGEAIGAGMVMAAELSARAGLIGQPEVAARARARRPRRAPREGAATLRSSG